MRIIYKTKGTCSQSIAVEVRQGIIESVAFTGGCHGNTQGLSRLVAGMKVDEVIDKLEGIRCGNRTTSCPDQLSLALRTARAMPPHP